MALYIWVIEMYVKIVYRENRVILILEFFLYIKRDDKNRF